MKHLSATGKIYVAQSLIPNAGRGVFAKEDIQKGEVIERCPAIEVPENDVANLNGSFLVTYFYYFGKKKNRLMLVLGYGSMYNHSPTPGARYAEKKGEVDFIALRNIKKGEEITVNYAQGKKKIKHPLWFETGE
jgi:SET domain-containing protein